MGGREVEQAGRPGFAEMVFRSETGYGAQAA
ncbi:hypothetical protein DSM104299_01830 [Baekduia alba]|nr:hypothetical protein DSM104299_01830 [Baekduia alba]